jgi:transcriptional regulator with XRE-family HTH domain
MKRKNANRTQIEFKKDADKIVKKSFGQNLKAYRERKDISQEAMAFIIGLSRTYYTEIENGKRNPSLVNIAKILAATEISFEKLLPSSDLKKLIK